MRPTEPGASGNAEEKSPEGEHPSPAGSASDAPVLATIVETPAASTLRPASAPLAGQAAVPARPGLPWNAQTDQYVDPFVTAADYAKALFSREAQEALFGGRTLDKVYSVPRRFDLSTLFVISTLFAMLFTVLGYLEVSSWAKLGWCLYFSGVGFAQAALYNGRAPRLASVLAGGMLFVLLLAPQTSRTGWLGALCWSPGLLIAGLPSGYIAGTLIGGVFLVADKLRNRIAERRAARVM